jgi:hypothetical protein
MGERLAKLKGAKLIASWTGFCELPGAARAP